MAKKGYYAVANGRSKGVYDNWGACESQVKGYSGANFRRFSSKLKANAYANSLGGSSSGGGSYAASSRRLKGSVKSNNVYTDGACRGNGLTKSAASGYGVYYGENESRNVSKPLSAVDKSGNYTSSRAELYAVKHALDTEAKSLRNGSSKGPLKIHSDSLYSIGSMTTWRENWKSNGWQTSGGKQIQNRDLIEPMSRQLDSINQSYRDRGWGAVLFSKVQGHLDNVGNIRADQLANQGADRMT